MKNQKRSVKEISLQSYINLAQWIILFSILGLSGCAGTQAFAPAVRAGDTVAVAAGWKKSFSKENISVNITDFEGSVFSISGGDPSIRGVINFYLDPVSNYAVAERINQSTTPNSYERLSMLDYFTGDDRDSWQTVVFIDLPTDMAQGLASIEINQPPGSETASSTVEIIGNDGSPNVFQTDAGWNLDSMDFVNLGRATHNVVTFAGAPVPYAIQVELHHEPGIGIAHVINTRGDIKSISWSDDGENLRVLLTPSKSDPVERIQDFKFYVAGGILNLEISGAIQAYDENGQELAGIIATID